MSIGTIGPGPEADTWEFSAPSESEPRGRLEFPGGAARMTIHAASTSELFRARFWGSPPAVFSRASDRNRTISAGLSAAVASTLGSTWRRRESEP